VVRGECKELSTLHYNDKITLSGIPLAAYDYIVNGKPALDWVVERQCVKTDKDSGIVVSTYIDLRRGHYLRSFAYRFIECC